MKNKDIQLTAQKLDLTHPYFVSIKDLVFSKEQKLIINPSEEDVFRAFGKAKNLMIPFQTVSLIEEFSEAKRAKVMSFPLIEESTEEEQDIPSGQNTIGKEESENVFKKGNLQ